jgi:hypothetical protein
MTSPRDNQRLCASRPFLSYLPSTTILSFYRMRIAAHVSDFAAGVLPFCFNLPTT